MSRRGRAPQSSHRKGKGRPSLGKLLPRSGADIHLFTPRLCPVTALSGALISRQSLWRRPFRPPIRPASQMSGLLLRLRNVLPASSIPLLSIPRRGRCDGVERGRERRLRRLIWVSFHFNHILLNFKILALFTFMVWDKPGPQLLHL